MAPWQGSQHLGGLRTTCSNAINQKAFSNSMGLAPIGALLDFVSPQELRLPRVQRAPVRCPGCHSYLNQYCKVDLDQGRWQCALCDKTNNVPAGMLSKDVSANAELCSEAVEYVIQPPRPGSGAGSPSTDAMPHVVLVIDTNIEEQHLRNIRQNLPAALQAELGHRVLVSVVGVDSVVTLWAVAGVQDSSEQLVAHTLNGDATMTQAGVSMVTRQCTQYWCPVDHVAFDMALGAIRPVHGFLTDKERPRCLAVGVEVALRLVASSARAQGVAKPKDGSRIIIITSGPPTVGPVSLPWHILDFTGPSLPQTGQLVPNARQHIASLVKIALQLNIPVDVMAVSFPAVSVSILFDLTEGTGGLLFNHQGDSPTMKDALRWLLTRTWGASGVLDCRVSSGLKLTQGWIGPVNEMRDKIRDGTISKSVLGSVGASDDACYVGRLSAGQGVSLRVELDKDLKVGENVHVQVVIHYHDLSTGAHISRVITRRVRVVGTVAEFIKGVDPVAAAVEVSKRLVHDTLYSHAHRLTKVLTNARASCASTVTLLASRFGRPQSNPGGGGGRRLTQLAGPLTHVAHSLYTLQRGRLLGLHTGDPASVVHPEERYLLMRTLINSTTATASAMINPPLYALMPAKPVSTGVTSPTHIPPPAHPTADPTATPTPPQPKVISPFTPGGLTAASSINTSDTETHADLHRLVPLPSVDLVLAAAQQAAYWEEEVAAAGVGITPKTGTTTSNRLPCLVLDLGTRLVLLDCAPHAPDVTAEQLKQQVAGTLPSLVQALHGEELTTRLLKRSPVPDVIALHILSPFEEYFKGLILGGVSAVQHDPASQQLVQLMEPSLSAANIEMDIHNPGVSQGACPWLYTTAVQLVNGSLGQWHQARKDGQGSKTGAGDIANMGVSFLHWIAELGVAVPTTS